MEVTMNVTDGVSSQILKGEVGKAEDALWKWVAVRMSTLPFPATVSILTSEGSAQFEMRERGTWFDEAGDEHPSMFIVPMFNSIGLPSGKYEAKYLTCIHENSRGGRGNYKFYWMEQLPDGRITAKYGRIGQGSGFGAMREIREPMESWLFWLRYYEKLSKGYQDRSDVYLAKDPADPGDAQEDEGPAGAHGADAELFALTLAYAKGRLRRSLVQGTDVTKAQLDASRSLVDELRAEEGKDAFNAILKRLMQVCPRNADSVRSMLARSADDFARIIDREESLVDAMDAVIAAKAGRKPRSEGMSFASFGVVISEADDSDLDTVYAHLTDALKKKVSRVWKVSPSAQRKRFEKRIKERGITKRRLLWHGSRNENWNSIIRNGLVLNPDAKRTGSMFGHGLYFAPSSEKSFNYSSCWGYWSQEYDGIGYMALCETAYGTPLVADWARQYSRRSVDDAGYDCVHAYRGCSGLRNEEIVFFSEDAVVLKYLVEFRG